MLDILQNETDESAKSGLRPEEAALVRLLRHQPATDGSAAKCVAPASVSGNVGPGVSPDSHLLAK